jgi:hypothetical protein
MRFSGLLAVIAACALSGCLTTTSKLSSTRPAVQPQGPDQPAKLTWEIENRYRLIATEAEEVRFRRYLSAYAAEYGEWFANERKAGPLPNILNSDLLHTDRTKLIRQRKDRGPGDNIAVNYDPRSTSYRCLRSGAPAVDPSDDTGCVPVTGSGASWIDDPNRTVRLSVAAWSGQDCLWRVDEGAPQKVACAAFEQPVRLKRPVKVTVRRADTEKPELTETVEARDVKIVALGDSFSAGEGNPHSQWRLFSIHRRPAYWLDPRCHRSLVSGPSLAAAYVAYVHPHASITLLHYGCSGASIADGVATPWAHLETSEGVDERWRSYQQLWVLVRRPTDQQTHPVNAELIHPPSTNDPKWPLDYPPSQIQQAKADLGGGRPDLVLLSTGGNDVGFADIVGGISRHDWTPDLTPERLRESDAHPQALDELRQVATFDEASWVGAAQLDPPQACLPFDADNPTSCVIAHFRQRAGYDGASKSGRSTLKSQYEVLHSAMAALAPEGVPVFLTAYPNFVNYNPKDRDGPTPFPAPADRVKPCEDHAFDGRPGFVPGVLTLFSSFGMRARDTGRVDEFLGPLNGVVKEQDQGSWKVIDAHVAAGQGHGYCSLDRWYNTYVDSLWSQGYRPSAKRPLGNFRVARAQGLHLPDMTPLQTGDGVVWDAALKCFALFDGPRSQGRSGADLCVKTSSGADPVYYEVGRTFAKGKPPRIADPNRQHDDPKIFDHVKTTGPVHPNLYGHCNYAAAIINEIASSQPLAGLLGPSSAEKPATALTVCSGAAWGFQTSGS